MVANEVDPINLKRLRNLYSINPTAKAVLDEFASRQRNQQTTKLDQLLLRLSNAGVSVGKTDVVKVLRYMSIWEFGTFWIGRKGHPTRFEWKYDLVSVGKAAAGGTQSLEEIPRTADQDNGDDEVAAKRIPEGAIQHTFQLRPNWQVELTLPTDLSAKEAGRLSDFIKTLPFDAQS
jgi:hypothetical protein